MSTPVIQSQALNFKEGEYGSATITCTANPVASWTPPPVAKLPTGLTFVDNGNNSCTVSGVPTENGVFKFLAEASNGPGSTAKVSIRVTVTADWPQIQSPGYLTLVAGESFNLESFCQARNPNGPTTWSRSIEADTYMSYPPGLGLSAGGTFSGTIPEMGFWYFDLVATDKASGGTDTQTFFVWSVGAGQEGGPCPTGTSVAQNGDPSLTFDGPTTVYPDPLEEIAYYMTLGEDWDGGGKCYIVPVGIPLGAMAQGSIKISNAAFWAPTIEIVDGGPWATPANHPVIDASSAPSGMIFEDVNLWGTGDGSYHGAAWVGQHGFKFASTDDITVINSASFWTGGDGMYVCGDYGNGTAGPCHNLTVAAHPGTQNGFTSFWAGRQAFTFAYCWDSPSIASLCAVLPAEGADMDMESDVGQDTGSIGCSNVTFTGLTVGTAYGQGTPGGVRIIEALQGPVNFTDCVIGGVGVAYAASASGQPVTFTNCIILGKHIMGPGEGRCNVGTLLAGESAGKGANLILDSCSFGLYDWNGSGEVSGDTFYAANGGKIHVIDPQFISPLSKTNYNADAGNDGSPGAEVIVTYTAGTVPTFTSAATLKAKEGKTVSFIVKAKGNPAPLFVKSGNLPTGLSWIYGSAIYGKPGPGTAGTYDLTITAANDAGTATQHFVLTVVAGSAAAPAILSSSAVSMTENLPVTATLMTSDPAATIGVSGALPSGVEYDGTSTLTGTPATGSAGTYDVVVTATNPSGSDTQALAITVASPPTPATAPEFTSANSTSLTVGTNANFTVTAIGPPNPTISVTSGELPPGVLFFYNTLIGAPTTPGIFTFVLSATNEAGTANQEFTVTVNEPTEAPVINADAGFVIYKGFPVILPVSATGDPDPVLSVTGTLPPGITFYPGSGSGGAFGGTASERGSFQVTLTAENEAGVTEQAISFMVEAAAKNPANSGAPA